MKLSVDDVVAFVDGAHQGLGLVDHPPQRVELVIASDGAVAQSVNDATVLINHADGASWNAREVVYKGPERRLRVKHCKC